MDFVRERNVSSGGHGMVPGDRQPDPGWKSGPKSQSKEDGKGFLFLFYNQVMPSLSFMFVTSKEWIVNARGEDSQNKLCLNLQRSTHIGTKFGKDLPIKIIRDH